MTIEQLTEYESVVRIRPARGASPRLARILKAAAIVCSWSSAFKAVATMMSRRR